jgi:hypothetical protein
MVLNISEKNAVHIVLTHGPLTRDEVRLLTDERRQAYLLSLIKFVQERGLDELARQSAIKKQKQARAAA